jgi:transposase
MNNQQINNTFPTEILMDRIAILERDLVGKESVIAERDSVIIALNSSVSKLTADLNAARFLTEQLRRMIFGSKRERFESTLDSNQMALEFEPKALEIEESVKAEREQIR